MDNKKVNTLAEFVNVFAHSDAEQFMDKLVLYAAELEDASSEEYPFLQTDKSWVQRLMDGFLQSEDVDEGEASPLKQFQSGINEYLASCRKENPEMYFLVEKFCDTPADENAR